MPDDPKAGLSWKEKVFVGGFALLTFFVSLGFVIATVGWGLGFPAVFVALALGLCVASIVYAFLGGVAGTEFNAISGLKLGGTLAAIAAIYYIVSGPLKDNMNDVAAIAAGKSAETDLKAERARTAQEHAARSAAEQQLQILKAEGGIKQSDTDAAILARIRQAGADDDLGRGIRSIVRNHEGPFRSQVLKLQARFLAEVPAGTFRYCHDNRPELQGKQVQLEVVDSDTGTSRKIVLGAGADIGTGACTQIKFDIQVGCDAAKALLPADCDSKRGVAWPSPEANHPYELVTTVLNPDL